MPVVPFSSPDASADFYAELNDPNRWVIKPGVPIFKPHQRVDPATGKLIQVDVPKLYRIAANMQRLERMGGVPVRMTIGHTEPGKAETEQPPVAGFYRNARVAQFGPMGEPAVVADEWLDPAHAPKRRNYPYRSSEYYDDTEQITGVALLARDPYLDLGMVAYNADADRRPVCYSRPGDRPAQYHLLLGDETMNPQFGPVGFPAAQPVYAVPAGVPVPPQYGGAAVVPHPTPYAAAPAPHQAVPPQFHPHSGYAGSPVPVTQTVPGTPPFAAPHQYAHPPAVQPVPYAAPGVVQQTPYAFPTSQPGYGYSAPYAGGEEHVRANIGHQHAGGWNHGIGYGHPAGYGVPPQMMPPHHRPPEKNEEDDEDLKGMYSALQHASNYLGNHIAKRGGRGPQRYEPVAGPMGMPGGAPPAAPPPAAPTAGLSKCPNCAALIPDSSAICPNCGGPTGAAGGVPPAPAAMGAYGQGMGTIDSPYARYADPAQPAQMARTISGLPVGYQVQLDRVNYELRNANAAIQMLMYERDQADSQACAAEISRLASVGYAVTDYNVAELKGKRTPQERAAYIQHIQTSYSRVGTDPLPPLLGDPTAAAFPGPETNRPASKEEMEAALKHMAASGSKDYAGALNYVRGGQQPTPYSDARPFPQYPAQYPPAAPHAALPNTQGPPYGPGPDPDAGLLMGMPANPYVNDGPSANGYANPYM